MQEVGSQWDTEDTVWRALDRQLRERGAHVLGGLGAGRGGGLLEEAGSNPPELWRQRSGQA